MKRICLFSILVMMAFCVACHSVEPEDPWEEVLPPEPVVTPDPAEDTLLVSLSLAIDVTEESLVKVKSGSDDLIGILIYTGTPEYVPGTSNMLYACGVFDNLDSLKFKFVKGKHYFIVANYFPDAKHIVYNYPDGTYGAPFSYLWGLKQYKLNVPVYDDGDRSDDSMPSGPELEYLDKMYVQPGESRYIQQFVIGTSLRYLGWTNLTVNDGTPINIRCEPWMMGIKLNAGNFTRGELILRSEGLPSFTHTFKPGDDMSMLMQIPAPLKEGREVASQGYVKILLYYSEDGSKTLMATKNLEFKKLVNYVFNFDLQEREDGTIGIVIVDGEYQNVNTTFD